MTHTGNRTMKKEQDILKKLSDFIRQYYRNEMTKGLLWLLLISLSAFILFISIDYFWQLGSIGRGILFYTWMTVFAGVLATKILFPLGKILKITNGINSQEAAAIIGSHFPDVNDKLVNTVQLITEADKSANELLLASINQRSQSLSPLPFQKAINVKNTFSILKWSTIPLTVFVLMWFYSPQLIQNSTKRIVNYDKSFAPVAPFKVLVNYPEQVFTFEDVPVEINLSGDFLPSEVYLKYNGVRYLCEPLNNGFYFVIKQAQLDGVFTIESSEFNFGPYDFQVLKKPSVSGLTLQVNYPAYLKQQTAVFANLNDIIVPEGSNMMWLFNLQNADSLYFNGNNLNANFGNPAQIETSARKSFNYQFAAFNNQSISDTNAYYVEVVKDKYPSIRMNQWKDSTQMEEINFTGNITDDYGFKKLLVSLKNKSGTAVIDTININFTLNQQEFFYSFEVKEYLSQTDVELMFSIWDNDGVNGPKKTNSEIFRVDIPNKSDIIKKSSEVSESLVDAMEKSMKDAKELEKEWKKFSQELKDKKDTDWKDKKKLEELMKQQNALEDQLKKVQEQKMQKDALEKLSPNQKNELIKKQEAVDKLFEDLMSEEMKKMMEEIDKLMQELNKEQLQEKLEDFEMSNEQLNKELDRTLEIFKQLEVEKMVQDATEQLEELAKKQEELSEKNEEKDADAEELKKEQDELNKEFEDIKKQLDDLKEKNEELTSPADLPDSEESQEKIDEEMQGASESLGKNKKKKAKEKQESAAEQMKKMASALKESMESSSEEQNEEDIDALRALLENLIHLSFDQEQAMEDLRGLNSLDPQYLEINRKQSQFKENSVVIQDSLFALSKRVPQLSNIVNKEIGDLTQNMGKAIAAMAEQQTNQALTRQQYAMTSLNNLALLLDEVLQQLQQESANQKPGNANCKKPGGKKPNSGKMSDLQKSMAKQLDALKKAMKPGNKPGGSGKSGANGKMSKELARIAAEQAAIREEIEKLGKELENGKDGVGSDLKKIAKEMDEMEEEIAKKNISPELIKRQRDIMTRLLKAENAEREREMDNKRESKSAKKQPKGNQKEYLEYKNKKLNEQEMLKTLPPDLKPYYREKINTYFNQSNE